MWTKLFMIVETLRSNDATATRTLLKNWIWVLSVFIAIISTHLLCKCKQTFLRLNSKGPYPSSEREIKFRRCLFTFSIKRKIGHLHVVVVLKQQKKCRKKCDAREKSLFCWLNLFFLFFFYVIVVVVSLDLKVPSVNLQIRPEPYFFKNFFQI